MKSQPKNPGRPAKRNQDKGTRYCVFVDSITDQLWKDFSKKKPQKNNSVAICKAMREFMVNS